MKRKIPLHLFLLCASFLILGTAVRAQNSSIYKTEDEAKKHAGQGITFKKPEKFAQGDMAGFKGVLMLNLKAPAGIYVTYPNPDEEIEDLKKRALPFFANMFIHDEKKSKEAKWLTSAIPAHPGDIEDSGVLNLYEDDEQIIQITAYEREWNGLKFIYGYFAMKQKKDKKSKDLVDNAGKGIKEFEEFWKTLPALAK